MIRRWVLANYWVTVMWLGCLWPGWAQAVVRAAPSRVEYRVVSAEAAYRVNETLAGVGYTTAHGRTKAVTFGGPLVVDLREGLLIPTVRVDLTTLTSDRPRRDPAVQRALQTQRFPHAIFTPQPLAGVQLGRPEVEVRQLKGTLQLHGQTRDVVFTVRLLPQGRRLEATATTQIDMRDFGIQPPSVLGLVSVEETVTLEVQVQAEQA